MKNQQEKEHVSIYFIDYLKSIMQKYFSMNRAAELGISPKKYQQGESPAG